MPPTAFCLDAWVWQKTESWTRGRGTGGGNRGRRWDLLADRDGPVPVPARGRKDNPSSWYLEHVDTYYNEEEKKKKEYKKSIRKKTKVK